MAEVSDISSRLAAGRPAVENLQRYVWACHQIGYHHPDLTLQADQLWEWYGSEEGMDLTALHSDSMAFGDAAGAVQDALAVQERQLPVLSTAWQGAGAQASRDFLRRHGEASTAAAAAVRTAAEALYALRESLYRVVDAKIDAVVAIEGRAQNKRGDWLAAAETVTTGLGDRAVAAELIDQAVKPFVDSSVRSDWLTAMRAAISSTTDGYRRAATEIAAEGQPMFDVPWDLGPTWHPPSVRIRAEVGFDEPSAADVPRSASPEVTIPSAWSAPTATGAPPMAVPPAAVAPLSPLPEVPAGPAVPPLPSPGAMGSGMPDFGGGLSGLGSQFADVLSGLLGGAGSGFPLGSDLGDPNLDDPLDLNEADETDEAEADETDEAEADETDEAEADEADEAEADEVIVGEPASGSDAGDIESEAAPVRADSAPPPTPTPPPSEPLPLAEPPTADPAAAEQTPCSIAADAVPQVGDPPK